MKLVNKVWILGAVAAFGMGAAAEGCSSSSQGNGGGSTDADCVALEACCATLSGSNATMCMTAYNTGVDSTCAAYLTEIHSANLCTGTTLPGGPDTGTSTGTPDTGTVTPGKDSGTGGSPDTGTTGSKDAGAGSDCEAPPSGMVYVETKAGVYCPFTANDAGHEYCTAAQHCCEPAEGSGASTCEATGTACPVAMSTDWQCEGTPDCSGTAGTVCCGTGTVETQAACGTNAAYPYISKFTGSSCAASCASTYQICSQTSECPSGMTCVLVKPKGNTIGICQ